MVLAHVSPGGTVGNIQAGLVVGLDGHIGFVGGIILAGNDLPVGIEGFLVSHVTADGYELVGIFVVGGGVAVVLMGQHIALEGGQGGFGAEGAGGGLLDVGNGAVSVKDQLFDAGHTAVAAALGQGAVVVDEPGLAQKVEDSHVVGVGGGGGVHKDAAEGQITLHQVVGGGVGHLLPPAVGVEDVVIAIVIAVFVLTTVDPGSFGEGLGCAQLLHVRAEGDLPVTVIVLDGDHILVQLAHEQLAVAPGKVAVLHTGRVGFDPYGGVDVVPVRGLIGGEGAVYQGVSDIHKGAGGAVCHGNADGLLAPVLGVPGAVVEIILLAVLCHLTGPGGIAVSPGYIGHFQDDTLIVPGDHVLGGVAQVFGDHVVVAGGDIVTHIQVQGIAVDHHGGVASVDQVAVGIKAADGVAACALGDGDGLTGGSGGRRGVLGLVGAAKEGQQQERRQDCR